MRPPSRGARLISAQRAYVSRVLLPPVQEFISREISGGIVLLAAAAVALVWANSPWNDQYFDLWGSVLTVDAGIFRISEDLQHWVNDALMAVFFFVVALEIKREVLHGELAGVRLAALPAAAALGGMIVPALLFTALNAGGDGARGWGIPMATDIAFALGVLALLGNRIPSQLRLFLLALAIVDDMGAILVIAVFYTNDLAVGSLGIAGLLVLAILSMQLLRVRSFAPYALAGVALWVAVFESGVHATIAGVVLGLLTPSTPHLSARTFFDSARGLLRDFRQAFPWQNAERTELLVEEMEDLSRETEAPLERLERVLHPWSSYVVLPVFALANAGISLSGDTISDAASSSVTIGVMVGLLAGKLTGILLAAWMAVQLRIARLPAGVGWRHLAGAALLGGIGFTVSLFITGLAFDDARLTGDAKIGVLAASVAAGLAGYWFLRLVPRPAAAREAP